MVTIACDICGKTKKPTDDWILGYDLEFESPRTRSLRRALTFLERWDDRRIVELGAVHFCCEKCRDEYVARSKAA